MNDTRYYVINKQGRFRLLSTTDEAAKAEMRNDRFFSLHTSKLIKETREVIDTHTVD